MITTQTKTCTHDWGPLQSKSARSLDATPKYPNTPSRYQCKLCRVLGYSPVKWRGDLRDIVPYICKIRGCKRRAVAYVKFMHGGEPKRLCIVHRFSYLDW